MIAPRGFAMARALAEERDEARADSPAKTRIVAGARRHFFAHGFRGVTMDDLAAELGMSKKTLYEHFSSKIELVEAVIREKFRGLDEKLDRITAIHATDFLTALHEMLARLQRETEEIQPPFVRDIRREAMDLFELVQEKRRLVIERYFGKLFAESRREGMIRKDVPARLIIEILLGATQAIMNPPKMEELGLTPKTGFSAIISVVLKGVLANAGRTAQ
jgi:AcrR family transcriptional regulator